MPAYLSDAAGNMLPKRATPHTYAAGDIVPWRFIPGIVVASFFASLSGTLLTIELLQRKRLGKSLVSRLQLFGCALSMGLIGIWCMHFIGNRSVTLANNENELQLLYSPGYTGLSCVLPVLGLTVAFQIGELSIKSFALRRTLDIGCGFLAGLSIVAMHYVGNLGTVNYTLIYPARYVAAACIIAVGDSIIALALFFYFKEKWINVFWKRCVCAVLLAVGVCGMHFTASIGCTYRLVQLPAKGNNQRRNTPVVVAATLCFVAAASCLLVLSYVHRRNKTLAHRAQQVMLACAFFDDAGNIMVTNEGALPSQRIAKRFALQKFDDHFGVHHPVFQWIWKVSHDWDSVADLVPKMRNHLQRPNLQLDEAVDSASFDAYDEESYHGSTIAFREGYCVAAADLASQLQAPLDQLGALYDHVVGTGFSMANAYKGEETNGQHSESHRSPLFEKGQLLFFTRKLRPDETDHYVNVGFRFAPFHRVEGVIARTMQVPTGLLGIQMGRVHEYARRMSIPPPPKQGSYFVCLAALARVRGTFQVLVPRDRQEDLPDVQLTSYPLTSWQIAYLGRYNGWSAEKFVSHINMKDESRSMLNDEEKSFVMMLRKALVTMGRKLGDRWFFDLIFNSEPLCMRYGANKAQKDGMAIAFGFTRLLDIHQSAVRLPDGLILANLDFIRARQDYYPGCNDHGRIRHDVHTEFGPLLTKHEEALRSQEKRQSVIKVLNDRRSQIIGGRRKSNSSHDTSILKQDSWTESVEDGRVSVDSTSAQPQQQQRWGGILATTDTIIVESSKVGSGTEMRAMAPQVTAGATALAEFKEPKSYIDMLYAQAKSHSAQLSKSLP